MKKIPLTKGMFVKVDDRDYETLSQHKWLYDAGYAKRHKRRPERGWIMMHRTLLEAPRGMFCDHINGDKLDNRRSNLRVCTNGQNMMNRGRQSNNSSGFRGVCWHRQRNKWRAYIKRNGKQIALGLFDSKEAAAQAYKEAAQKLFKEFFNAKTR